MKTRIKQFFLLPALMAGLGLIPAGRVTAQTFTNLYSFMTNHANSSGVNTNSDGAYPSAGLILSGNILYGTASGGGTNGNGTVFAVHTDGTGFTILHTFTPVVSGTNSDGANPVAGLLQSGQYLYGTASAGGTNGNGTVFFVRTDGLYFTNLHSFTALSAPYYQGGTNSDGAIPRAGLILSGDILYGTAGNGGTNGNGTVFAVNADGTGFTVLHTFTAYSNYTNSDGANPAGGLISSGNTLYGTASGGGSGGDGTVFALTNNGTTFTNLYSFTGGSDGDNPYAGLTSSGNTLFGTAGNGGNSFDGTLFAVTTNGVDFTTLHAFTNNPDGGSPHAGLILSGNTLYGTAEGGGTNGTGMVFSLTLPTPQLTITFSGTNAIVMWPTNALEFTLQSTTNPVPPTVWTTISPPPYAVIYTNNVVTNTISGTNQFYRLSL
jgi:uncharacterized repeat protein (TIGR03803 family)